MCPPKIKTPPPPAPPPAPPPPPAETATEVTRRGTGQAATTHRTRRAGSLGSLRVGLQVPTANGGAGANVP